MVDPSVPQDIIALADERATARHERDYRTADELKARIEAAGWKVVDFGVAYELEPARPADLTEGEHTRYGSVDSVPSRLDEPAATDASVIVIDDGADLRPSLEALASTAPLGTQVLVVAGPDSDVDGPATEVVATAVPFGAGDALQAALRRTTGATVIVLEPELRPTENVVASITASLTDPSVAIVAADGLHSADLHRYHPAEPGDATTVASGCYGFRRADAVRVGPIDARLKLRGSVAAWLGLSLRDAGPEAEPRRALVLELPLEASAEQPPLPHEHAHLARRDGYRIADRFRDHAWLAGHEPPQGWLVGDGTDDDQPHDDAQEGGHADEA